MEYSRYIKNKKDLYSSLIDYIDAFDDSEAEFTVLIEMIEKQEILQSEEEKQLLFQLISKIADNHHRSANFFGKLEKLISFLIKDKPKNISQIIPEYLTYNKRLLLFLFEKEFVIPDQLFLTHYFEQTRSIKNFPDSQYFYYLYPGIKKYIDEATCNTIEHEISEELDETIESFDKKCQIGENDSYIC